MAVETIFYSFNSSGLEPEQGESMAERRRRIEGEYTTVLSYKLEDIDPINGSPLQLSREEYDELQRARGAIGYSALRLVE